ncbi:MAG TPA: hypothetical protein DCL21_04095 [Alphaproteobacteria bacterium]|nr:hypothetical protein [Alphaproteobacteria bacterium]
MCNILNKIFNKKGAVFGIDARISLILISIASLAIAVNKQSLNESRKIKDVTFNILELEDLVMDSYKKNHLNDRLLVTGYSAMTDTEKKELWQGRENLYKDPWGEDWVIKGFSSDGLALQALGHEIKPACFIIFSAGADGYHHINTGFPATNYTDCVNNVGLPTASGITETSDDYFYKFTTVGYEIELNKDTSSRLENIQQALLNYSQAQKNIRVNYCNDLSASAANADAKCDIDTNGTYVQAELDNVNYLPKSTLDVTAAKYANATAYNPATLANMESLMLLLGLPKSYSKDLIGRTLQYRSNVNSVIAAPFVASFYYKA